MRPARAGAPARRPGPRTGGPWDQLGRGINGVGAQRSEGEAGVVGVAEMWPNAGPGTRFRPGSAARQTCRKSADQGSGFSDGSFRGAAPAGTASRRWLGVDAFRHGTTGNHRVERGA